MAFLDPTKAFDSVPRRIIIWQSSERRKVTGKLIQVIKSLYSKTWNYVRTENKQSKKYRVKEGLRQGGVLSPTLFVMIMDDIMEEGKMSMKKMYVGHTKLQPVWLTDCAFADDITVCAAKEKLCNKT
ncbi:hypothetical protein Zmor_011250 [Zophobas morio]|uniref:Reverse transcriptase domain-containing protein n=1 Tax=Zophobas morio TaxID=2755281 RepID=A0AA38ILQ6_9CUCU|nr:hypothetical protein Zmor_011250 [Zophobas morio]